MLRHCLILVTLLSVSSVSRGGFDEYFADRNKNFGPVPRGPLLTHQYKFTNSGKAPLTISALRVSCGCVTAWAPVATIQPGETSFIGANMDTRRFTGPKSVTIYVQFISPRFEEVSLEISANGREDFAVSPETMAFGQVRKGTSPTASVRVTLVTDPNWQITEVVPDSNYVQPKATLVKRESGEVSYDVTASLRPDLPVGKWYTDIWAKTTSPIHSKVRIPIVVEVLPPITVSPGIVQFAGVKVGGSAELNVVVRSEKPFQIKEFRGGSSEFTITNMSSEAKEVQLVKIVFKPTKEARLSQDVAVIAVGETAPLVTIPIRANAISGNE